MKMRNQSGSVGIAGIVAIVMTLFFIVAIVLFAITFSSKQDYKNNSDKKAAAAVAVASKQLDAKKEADFAEREKSPLKTYAGPATFGTVVFDYPKTYSAYVISGNSSAPLDGSFYPNVVPGNDPTIAFALRLQVLDASYDSTIKQYESNTKSGKVTVKPFRAAKVPNVLGIRVDAEIATGKQGSMILLPLRDKTLKIWAESKEFVPNLDKYILPSLSFIP